MGKIIFDILKIEPKFIYFPSLVFKIIGVILYPFGLLSTRVREIREFVRIAHYYATESMLVWDEKAGAYSSDATPEVGIDTLRSFYLKIVESGVSENTLQHNRLFK